MTEKERHETNKRFLIECLSRDLIIMLMEDHHMDMKAAMDTLYTSETYKKLENEKTGLYYQGPVYVMSFLQQEKDLPSMADA